ncbi:hypothetical protein CHU98_g4921 [Xylaria longipes]|nr:hypothetical protein CHU98_g4921 [Xylaria longipes]
MSSTTPAASVDDIARHGWTAVPVDANIIFDKNPIVKPSAWTIADIQFPADDPVVAEVQRYAKEHLTEQTYNHSMRVYHWGFSIIKDQFPELGNKMSLSTWALTCLLHDIGTTHDNLRATLLSFEFYGGILALNLTQKHGASTAQAEAVAEAIIRHQDLGTVGTITFLGQVIQLATIYDNMGGNPGLIDEVTRLDVNGAFPRKGWSGCFSKTIREENGLKPWAHTTHLGEEDFPEGVKNNSLMTDDMMVENLLLDYSDLLARIAYDEVARHRTACLEIHTPAPPASATEDQEILDNIDGRMHGPMTGGASCRCAVPSAAPSPDSFLQWVSNYVSLEFDGARGSWRISGSNGASERESDDDGAHVLLAMTTSPASDVQARWDDIQVVGQFHRCRGVCYQDGISRLCRSAYEVFASQPTRLFLHGFYIRGSLIELWVFDRSGLYCSDMFDIRQDFVQFLSVILSYQQMTDQDLGVPSIIKTDEGGSYISLDDSDQWNYVLKFKWRWARERPEDELLRLAKEKGVWGAVSLDYYDEIESTANLRRGLRWGTHRKFTNVQFPERSRSIEEQQKDDACNAGGLVEHMEETDNLFQNRILACIVTSPVGRPLHTFQPFMAISVLRSEHHTYHHDLESFLYVFLWAIITNHAESPPETSRLRQWSNGDWDELAARKSFDMKQDSFQSILAEFPHEFHSLKPLAEILHQILFPLRTGVIWTGTNDSPEGMSKLYDEIIRVFEEAIASESERFASPP